MKRACALAVVAVLALMLTVLPAGCGKRGSASNETAGSAGASAVGTAPEGYDAMAADGANEQAALAALPAILDAQKSVEGWSDVDWRTLEAQQPRLVAYIVRVQLGDQMALFEVRADGIAHNLYAYGRAFDSGSIIWTIAANEQRTPVAPVSAGEATAVAAVETAMRDAFPEDPFSVAIEGYRFAYLIEGNDPIVFEVGADGTAISAVR